MRRSIKFYLEDDPLEVLLGEARRLDKDPSDLAKEATMAYLVRVAQERPEANPAGSRVPEDIADVEDFGGRREKFPKNL